VQAAVPKDITDTGLDVDRAALMYDMAKLALESDSTRVITIYLQSAGDHAQDTGELKTERIR